MRAKLKNTVGTSRLSELVKGKRRVAILIDDIQRPTPIKRIVPLVLEELKAGGIEQDAIIFFMAVACHRSATEEDFIKKLGANTVKNIKTLSHDCTRDSTYLGKTERGTPIYVNKFVMECDVKIGIGGVYPHESAGFGGGAKIIHPGICGKETARYLHSHLKGVPRGGTVDNEFRADMEEIAEKVGLDFSINTLLNKNRDISHISCGHRVTAHQEAVKVAKEFYGVRPIDDADIIITNAFPFDTSLHFLSKGLWPFNYGTKKSSRVIIASCAEGLGYHALSLASLPGWSRFFHRIRALSRHDIYRRFSRSEDRESEFFLFSPNIKSSELKRIYRRAKLFKTWESLIRELSARHKKVPIKVAVYQCAPLQVPLDSDCPLQLNS
jgi:nickel-dependent lactate racemase